MKKCLKNILLIVLLVSALAVLIWLSVVYSSILELNKFNHVADLTKMVMATVGAFWVLFEFYSKRKKQLDDHLNLTVSIDKFDSYHLIKTSLENTTLFPKQIEYAFLIISKFDVDFMKEINSHFKLNLEYSNQLFQLKQKISEKFLCINDKLLIIPLSFYYKENVRVANEQLTYSIPILSGEDEYGDTSKYEVRFFVYRNKKDTNNYHRLTQCSFICNKTIEELDRELHICFGITNSSKNINKKS